MCSVAAVLCVFLFAATSTSHGVDGKTYYFNVNKTSNEFLIYNRVNLDKNVQNYPARIYLSEIRNISAAQRNTIDRRPSYPILDPEWDYNSDNITRSELPTYIHKLYEAAVRRTVNINYGPTRILFNTMPRNSTVIKFELSSLNAKENISDVELYFYLNVSKDLQEKSLVLRLYQIEDDHFNESSLINPDAHKLLNVIYVLEAESGWQVFKLKNGVENWLNGEDNLGLLLTISKPNQDQFSLFRDKNRDALRTFAVVKSTQIEEKGASQAKESVHQPNSCRRHHLYVEFRNSNWLNFIVSPEGYAAYSCFGKCYKNDNSLVNYTKMLNVVPNFGPKSLCCVPTDYSSLPIMFYDKHGNIAIKVYKDMVVARCGCR